MSSTLEQDVVVAYAGDETRARQKVYGASIIDQMFASVDSIRKNWSVDVEIVFIHTEPLSASILERLSLLNVSPLRAGRKVSSEFPIANKFLVGPTYRGPKDILFLDCDTIVHRPLDFQTTMEMLVALDALQDVAEDRYRRLYAAVGVELPRGDFSYRPSYEYYYNDRIDLFPLLNTGVYYVKNKHKDAFYSRLELNFFKTYDLFRDELTFYFDQICFALTAVELGLRYEYFPKGYNFICTPRASHLRDWPRDKIFIEHYAGDSSRPLEFDGNRIDPQKSGLLTSNT
jgi:hypothetical protein